MSLGNILGQLLQQGMSGQTKTQDRLGAASSNIARDGQGVDQLLGRLQTMLGGGTGGTGGAGSQGNPMAGFADAAKSFLGGKQAGGMSGAQIGGLGALAGAVLGGGSMKGAARGGAMAILGTLALNALQKSQAGGGAGSAPIDASALDSVASEEGERLALRAMIAAAKADGQIDQTEMDRILGKLEPGEVTAEDRQFVMEEIRAPLDAAAIARDVRTPAQAAEVYAASLLAIDVDSDAERQYLRDLAAALKLDETAVAYLHETTGAPRS